MRQDGLVCPIEGSLEKPGLEDTLRILLDAVPLAAPGWERSVLSNSSGQGSRCESDGSKAPAARFVPCEGKGIILLR